MKINISINEEYHKNPQKYAGSIWLTERFKNRGHDVRVIHPNQIYQLGTEVFSKKEYVLGSKGLELKNNDKPITGDVFFVRSYAQDYSEEDSLKFMNLLYGIEKQVGFTINSAEATSYSYKPKQKKLNLPWVPDFNVSNQGDLEKLLEQDKKLIAKPNFGIQGKGIEYWGGLESLGKIFEGKFSDYCFEKFIPADFERRYVFLGGDLILTRDTERIGLPGKEVYGKKKIVEPDFYQTQIAQKAMDLVGMDYGCVDFRGENILEINGSGTGTFSEIVQPLIVDFVEKKVNHDVL